jgi:hypothetical protein
MPRADVSEWQEDNMHLDETTLRFLLGVLVLAAAIGLLPALIRVFRVHDFEVRQGNPDEHTRSHT